MSVTVQPLDGAPAVSHVPSLWSQVDCNFGDGVGILVQHVSSPAPSLPNNDGLHILLLAPCSEDTVGDGSWPKEALDFPEACRVKGQPGQVLLSHPPAL